MNERIKELADMSYVTCATTKGMETIADGCYITTDKHIQRFAELIVRETMQVVANNMSTDLYRVVANEVIEHFGEKE